jgi:hypothetical protein
MLLDIILDLEGRRITFLRKDGEFLPEDGAQIQRGNSVNIFHAVSYLKQIHVK